MLLSQSKAMARRLHILEQNISPKKEGYDVLQIMDREDPTKVSYEFRIPIYHKNKGGK